MALSIDEVRKIASLARLRFSPAEEVVLAAQLGHIVEYIDQLQRLEGGAAAMSGPGPAPRPETPEALRASDEPVPCLPRETFLANAPAALGAFLLVPEIKGGGDDAS
jgi:aspartyl-tRNA(Asn)/glutamyl-tRNA(Gln) amidotransferase subunit C